jgi:hypothetical protein
MQFNDTTNKNGIIQWCEEYTGLGDGTISGNSDKLLKFTSRVNVVSSRVWHTIFEAQGCWEYDDGNQIDLSIATTDLIVGQADYALPSDSLVVKRVEVSDAQGNWTKLNPLIREDIKVAIPEYFDTDGSPCYYRLLGETIEIFPPSDTFVASGLRVYYDRGSFAFSSSDTTKTAGFALEYHDILPLGSALDWLMVNLPGDARTSQIEKMYYGRLQQLKAFFNKRYPAKHKKITRRFESFK